MSEETTAVSDVESRIEERLFPPPAEVSEPKAEPVVDERPKLEAVPDDSEPVAKIDSNEISSIPDGDESETEEEVKAEPKAEEPKEPEPRTEEEEELYQQLGVEPDQVIYDDETGLPLFKAKVGDDEFTVPFKDLVKSYQLEKHITKKSVALSEKQKEFEETYGGFQSQFGAKLEEVEQLSAVMEKNLIGEYNQVDWDGLKASNPTQYAVQRQAYSEKAEALQATKDALLQEREQLTNQQKSIMERKFAEFKAQQADKLMTAYPEWLNPDVMRREIAEIHQHAVDEYGFTDQELEQIYDSRIIKVLADAKAYRSAKKNVDAKVQKEVPKFQKPGQRVRRPSEAAKAAKAKRAALRKSGNQTDLTNVLVDRM